MFNISDVMIDKEEVSLTFQLPVTINEEDSSMRNMTQDTDSPESTVKTEQIYVSESENSVPESHIKKMVQKAAGILAAQGVSCCECSKSIYKLYRLSDCGEGIYRYSLNISCGAGTAGYQFELSIQSPHTVPVPAGDVAEKRVKSDVQPRADEK